MVQGAEMCRALSAGTEALKQELERSKASLLEAKRRTVKAAVRRKELRFSEAKAGLLAEELEAVRGDCGRLVQLVRCGTCRL